MIKVLECLDIELIERLRQEYIHRPLDEHDSFSYHLVLEVDGVSLGAARLYRCSGGLLIDCIATPEGLDVRLREMLARSIISRAVDLTDERIFIDDDGADLFSELGFKRENGKYVANAADVVFKCKCKKP